MRGSPNGGRGISGRQLGNGKRSLRVKSRLVSCTLTRRKRMDNLRIRRRCVCRLKHLWITAKAWLMSCGDNLDEANMALKEDPNTPDAGQLDPAALDMRALVGEMAPLMHSAARLVGTTMRTGWLPLPPLSTKNGSRRESVGCPPLP
eukprot:3206724-Pleurochrysis_carterae.AAC.3